MIKENAFDEVGGGKAGKREGGLGNVLIYRT